MNDKVPDELHTWIIGTAVGTFIVVGSLLCGVVVVVVVEISEWNLSDTKAVDTVCVEVVGAAGEMAAVEDVAVVVRGHWGYSILFRGDCDGKTAVSSERG